MTLGERNGQTLKGDVPENIPIKIIANFEFVHGRLSEMNLMTNGKKEEEKKEIHSAMIGS